MLDGSRNINLEFEPKSGARFADVFDDVMEDVLARGVIGDEADGDRVRGAVGV